MVYFIHKLKNQFSNLNFDKRLNNLVKTSIKTPTVESRATEPLSEKTCSPLT